MGKFKLVSADSHVVEPADLWLELIDPAFRDRAPRIRRDEKGEDAFYAGDARILAPAAMSQAGKDNPDADRTVAAVYAGAYDPKARLVDMARDGVEAEVLYPSVTMRVFGLPDPALREACFRAYNTWIAGFCNELPDRFKGLAVIDLTDLDRAVGEVERARKLGLAGLMVTIASDDPNLYGDTRYDRFWAAAQDLALPVSLHIITGQKPITFDAISDTLAMVDVMQALAQMIFSGLFERFPRLKVVSAENDGGWAGYFVERMDRVFTEPRRAARRHYAIQGKGMLPSDYMRRNVALTFIRDRTAVEVRHWVGVENLMWSSDYPHNDSTWPNSRQTLDYVFAGVPEADRDLIAATNAERLYGLGRRS